MPVAPLVRCAVTGYVHAWRSAGLPMPAGAMAWEDRAGRSGSVKTSGYRKSPSARICKRKGIWKAAMRWKEARA